MNASLALRRWVKRGDHPVAALLLRLARARHAWALPVIRPIHRPLYALHRIAATLLHETLRGLWYTPLFRARLEGPAPRLHLYGGMPLVIGPVRMRFGSDCRVSGIVTITGRSNGTEIPELVVGSNIDLGWQTTIAVGRRVVIGNNVRLAGRALLAGYPGHPLDPADRAAGLPDTEDQVGDIVLEDDVWLATGVSVMAGVTIGRGTVVAAGSVVTKSLPPGVLAGGVPARVIRPLREADRAA
jgi:acetyltransferase-like isoleucine patch superfamily enzyme